MHKEICYDKELKIEAYRFKGISQPFPNHFHNYYVIGYVEAGKRFLCCKNKKYEISSGDILLLNPNDIHGCEQCSNELLTYKSLNISKEKMISLMEDIDGKNLLPEFTESVIRNEEIKEYFQILHSEIMSSSEEFKKEEILCLLVLALVGLNSQKYDNCISDCTTEVDSICSFIENYYPEHITLNDLCKYCSLSKSTLLRSFTKAKGVTPYRYLQAIRIDKAKKLLEQGMPPVKVAVQTGFSDQSHFNKSFNMFIGLSPGTYRKIFMKGSQE